MVRVVPQFRRDEDFRARDTAAFDSATAGRLCAIDTRRIDVAVPSFEGGQDCAFLGVFVLPGSKSDSRCEERGCQP